MSNLTEGILIAFFLGGGLLLILSTYIFGVCRNKSHNNFIMFNTLLMSYDWIFYIIFNIWIFTADLGHVDLDYMNSIPFLTILLTTCLMVFFHSILTFIILLREINNNEQFRAWFQEHKVFCLFIAFFSLGNLNVLHVLNCKFNSMDIFDAKLSFTVEKKIIHASAVSIIVGDVPRVSSLLIIHFLYAPASAFNHLYAISIICTFLSGLVFIIGFFYRIYESLIRDYEKPTAQEFTAQEFTAQELTAQELIAQELTAQKLTAQELTAQELIVSNKSKKQFSEA
ncbi:unnamed protein product [Rhizophagus irregularis]|nr:unnamed protein product [Rhizophagus irregularis]CAB5384865.1 unnamed protein product [Rhizophagus irregularis]